MYKKGSNKNVHIIKLILYNEVDMATKKWSCATKGCYKAGSDAVENANTLAGS